MAVTTHPVPLPAALRQGVDPHVGIGAGVQGLGAKGLHHLLLTVSLHRTRRWLTRRSVRRALDAVTGMVLLGFGARPAAERV